VSRTSLGAAPPRPGKAPSTSAAPTGARSRPSRARSPCPPRIDDCTWSCRPPPADPASQALATAEEERRLAGERREEAARGRERVARLHAIADAARPSVARRPVRGAPRTAPRAARRRRRPCCCDHDEACCIRATVGPSGSRRNGRVPLGVGVAGGSRRASARDRRGPGGSARRPVPGHAAPVARRRRSCGTTPSGVLHVGASGPVASRPRTSRCWSSPSRPARRSRRAARPSARPDAPRRPTPPASGLHAVAVARRHRTRRGDGETVLTRSSPPSAPSPAPRDHRAGRARRTASSRARATTTRR
jgi:hypothetical protein